MPLALSQSLPLPLSLLLPLPLRLPLALALPCPGSHLASYETIAEARRRSLTAVWMQWIELDAPWDALTAVSDLILSARHLL